MNRPRPEWVVFAIASTALCLMAAGGAGWLDESSRAATAYGLLGSHAPGHALLGKLATLVPIGEVAFRVALLSAVSMAAAIAGTVALARALVPSETVAAIAAGALVAMSPVLQVNGTQAQVYGPTAALLVWAMVQVLRHLRAKEEARRVREPLLAALLCGTAATMDPIIAAAASLPMAVAIARSSRWRHCLAALACALLPLLAYGYLLLRGTPELPIDVDQLQLQGLIGRFAGLALMSGEGLGLGILLGGLLGLCFGTMSGLRGAGVVLATLVSVLCAAALQGSFDPNAPGRIAPALLLLAAGIAPTVGAVMRMLPGELAAGPRALASGAVLLPILGIGLAGSVLSVTDSGFRRGDSPTRWVAGTVGQMPPGPGTYVLQDRYAAQAHRYEQQVAGHRPDVTVLTVGEPGSEALISEQLRAGGLVGGELAANRARPLGYGYLYGEAIGAGDGRLPNMVTDSDITRRMLGRAQLERAGYLAGKGRLQDAISEARVQDLFTPEELATVDSLAASPQRAAWFTRVPRHTHVFIWSPWQSRLWADDLAWTLDFDRSRAEIPVVYERRVHWWWRRLERGLSVPDSPGPHSFEPPPRPAK